MKWRKLLGLWPYLPLLFPYYLLTSAAAWLALYDLILRPYHWHKTEHGLAKTSRQAMLTLAARAAAAKANLLGGIRIAHSGAVLRRRFGHPMYRP